MSNLLSMLAGTIEAALKSVQERLRPNCRRVVLRVILFGVPVKARCGDPIEWACATGYCSSCCHEHCQCGGCGCGIEDDHGAEVMYDAAKASAGMPS